MVAGKSPEWGQVIEESLFQWQGTVYDSVLQQRGQNETTPESGKDLT